MKAAGPLTSTPEILTPRLRGGPIRSPLRRSGVLIARPTPGNEDRNDDEAERSSLVARDRTPASTPRMRPSADSGSVGSINSSPQKEHFQGCLKLYAENKITKDNAWSLQLIDFMTSMLRRHDARMENLQMASTMVDASARIYSFRVDAVHHEGMKMAGGLTKVAHMKRGRREEGSGDEAEGAALDGEPAGAAIKERRKKKKRGAIATAPEQFSGDFEANECIDPFFEKLAATTGDVTSSNRAFNATLPIHDYTLALILRMDEPFLEPVKENVPETVSLTARVTLALRLLPPLAAADQVCEPFTNFSIGGWQPESEEGDNQLDRWVQENRLNLSQQALAFDVNAEVEPVPQDDDHNDLLDDEPLGGIESDEEQDAAVAACVARLPAAPLARLTDMRPAAPGDQRLEYSYCSAIVSAWAGPSHWRLRNNRASKTSERTQSTVGGRATAGEATRRPARTRRQLDFVNAGVRFEPPIDAAADYAPAQPNKIMISRKTLSQGQAWSEKNFKRPIDRGLDGSHFQRLFLKRSARLPRRRELAAAEAAAARDLSAHEPDVREYDYDNENDFDYCPNMQPEGEEVWGNEEGAAAEDLHGQLRPDGELGDMLEPPNKVAKIFIPHAMRAKKVDMKQLKNCTWSILHERDEELGKDRVPTTTFRTVYSQLPDRLSDGMRGALSVPLALLAVLHIANEKGLVLESHEDNKDFSIQGLINE